MAWLRSLTDGYVAPCASCGSRIDVLAGDHQHRCPRDSSPSSSSSPETVLTQASQYDETESCCATQMCGACDMCHLMWARVCVHCGQEYSLIRPEGHACLPAPSSELPSLEEYAALTEHLWMSTQILSDVLD